MASKALYSEVVELVLNIEKFKDAALESHQYFDKLITMAKEPIRLAADATKFISAIDDALARETLLTEQLRVQNTVLKERRAIYNAAQADAANRKMFGPLMGGISQHNAGQAGMSPYQAATPTAASAIGGAFAANVRAADYAALKQDLARREQAHMNNLVNEQRIAALRTNAARDQAAKEDAIRDADYAALKQDLARRERESAVRNTAGYRVGAFASQARVGAALDLAAGAGFAVGGTNLGGMLYMMERLSYATGVGQKNLGEFAAKLGLVKTEGAGADASIAGFGSRIMVLGGIAAAVAGVVGLTMAGRALNKELAVMSTLLEDMQVPQDKLYESMDKTAAAAGRLAQEFNISIVEVTKGFYSALSTGIPGEQLEAFGKVAAQTARGLNTSFDTSINILTTLKDAYGASVAEMAEYSDILFNAIDVGKFTVKDLQANLGRVAVSAAEAGVGIKDMFTALAVLNRAGLSTSQAITSLNRFIQGVVSPTDKAKAAMEQLGITYGLAAFKGRALVDVIDEIRRKTAGNAELISDISGPEQGRRGATILTARPELYAEAAPAIERIGTAALAADRAMNTFGENMYRIWNAIATPIMQGGSDLLNMFNTMIFGSTESASAFDTLRVAVEAVVFVFNSIVFVGTSVVRMLGGIIGTISSLAQAALSLLTLDFEGAAENAVAAGKRLVDTFKTIGEAGARLASSAMARINAVTAEASDAVVKHADVAGNAMADVYSAELVSAMDTFGKKSVSVYENLATAISKARFEAEQLRFEQQYTPSQQPRIQGIAAPTAEERAYMGRVRKGAGADQHLNGYSPLSLRGQALKSAWLDANGALDPDDPIVLARMTEIHNARLARASIEGAAIGKAYAEAELTAKEAARKKWMGAAGLGNMLGSAGVATGAGDIVPMLKAAERAARTMDAVKEGKGIDTRVGSFTSIDGNTVTIFEKVVDKASQLAVLETQVRDARREYTAAVTAGTLTEEQRKVHLQAITKLEEDATILRKKDNEAIAARQKQELDHALKLYNMKVNAFNEEIKRLDKLLNKYEEFERVLADRRSGRSEDRRGAEFTFRDTRTRAEADLVRMENIQDPNKLLDAAKEFTKLIDRMMSSGKEAGYGDRASRFADDLESVLAKIMADKKVNIKGDIKAQENNIDNAIAKFKADMANNPVAQAALAQAMVVMQEAVKEAAKNGIGVAGDLVQDVNISRIDVNLPVREFENSVRKIAQTLITQYINDKVKENNPSTPNGGNTAPTGAESNI